MASAVMSQEEAAVEASPSPVPGRDPQVVDAYLPGEVAHRVRTAGVEDARRGLFQTFALSVIGGAMLGMAAAATTAVMSGSTVGYGQTRLLGGLVFGLGLTMVMVGGGELFTSNNLIAMAWVAKEVRTSELMVNWGLVYLGNIVGAGSIALLLFLGGAYGNGAGVVGGQALAIAASKAGRSFEQSVALGVLGNSLVCLAVWLCFSARSTTDRILSCTLPMIALVVLNVDHVVANMHYLAAGLVLRHDTALAASAGLTVAEVARIDTGSVVVNLVGVTIGNIIGGSVLVASVYWFVYLREGRGPSHGGARSWRPWSPRAGATAVGRAAVVGRAGTGGNGAQPSHGDGTVSVGVHGNGAASRTTKPGAAPLVTVPVTVVGPIGPGAGSTALDAEVAGGRTAAGSTGRGGVGDRPVTASDTVPMLRHDRGGAHAPAGD